MGLWYLMEKCHFWPARKRSLHEWPLLEQSNRVSVHRPARGGRVWWDGFHLFTLYLLVLSCSHS